MGLTEPAHMAHTDLKFATVAGAALAMISTAVAAKMQNAPRT